MALHRSRTPTQIHFPGFLIKTYSLDNGGARFKILTALRSRAREAVYVSPFRYAVACAPR